MFLLTHYMDEADFSSNRVAIIDNGKIVAPDTPKNLKDMIGADTKNLEAPIGGETLLGSLQAFDWIESTHISNGTLS